MGSNFSQVEKEPTKIDSGIMYARLAITATKIGDYELADYCTREYIRRSGFRASSQLVMETALFGSDEEVRQMQAVLNGDTCA